VYYFAGFWNDPETSDETGLILCVHGLNFFEPLQTGVSQCWELPPSGHVPSSQFVKRAKSHTYNLITVLGNQMPMPKCHQGRGREGHHTLYSGTACTSTACMPTSEAAQRKRFSTQSKKWALPGAWRQASAPGAWWKVSAQQELGSDATSSSLQLRPRRCEEQNRTYDIVGTSWRKRSWLIRCRTERRRARLSSRLEARPEPINLLNSRASAQ
jgi:hypothetical protein